MENVLGSTIQGKSNQIKLTECYNHQGCCCWQQDVAMFYYSSDKAFSEALSFHSCAAVSVISDHVAVL